MTSLACFALGLAAFAALSLAMERHRAQALRADMHRLVSPLAYRAGAWLLLLACVALCVRACGGVGVGLVFCCAVLCAAGWAVTLLLSYRPRWLPWVGVGALGVGCWAA